MDLFYGCRRSNSDFLFKDEWSEYAKELDGKFRLHVAFSREPGMPKVYVQNLVEEHSSIVCQSLIEKKGLTPRLQGELGLEILTNIDLGHVYICGDARDMAREVEAVLVKILGNGKGGGQVEGEKVEGEKELRLLKDRKRIALDVW